MCRVMDPVFAMAESFFLDGGSRLDDVDLRSLTTVSEWRPAAHSDANAPDVGRYRSARLKTVRAGHQCVHEG